MDSPFCSAFLKTKDNWNAGLPFLVEKSRFAKISLMRSVTKDGVQTDMSLTIVQITCDRIQFTSKYRYGQLLYFIKFRLDIILMFLIKFNL